MDTIVVKTIFRWTVFLTSIELPIWFLSIHSSRKRYLILVQLTFKVNVTNNSTNHVKTHLCAVWITRIATWISAQNRTEGVATTWTPIAKRPQDVEHVLCIHVSTDWNSLNCFRIGYFVIWFKNWKLEKIFLVCTYIPCILLNCWKLSGRRSNDAKETLIRR